MKNLTIETLTQRQEENPHYLKHLSAWLRFSPQELRELAEKGLLKEINEEGINHE